MRSHLLLVALLAATPLAPQVDTTQHATFHIVPRRPVDALRNDALRLTPPDSLGGTRPAELVELITLERGLHLDIRYASTNNFMQAPMYSQARAFLQRPAARALVRVHRRLVKQGYALLIHDAYRPWYVTWMFWEATPDSQHVFVANPATGSRHNRGCAVDLSLWDLKTGKPVRMPSGYDEMSPRAYPTYSGGTASERARRDLLRRAMEAEGFTVNEAEWWHFDYKDWRAYPVLNTPFERLK